MSFPYDGHDLVNCWRKVGSRVTCDPPPTDADEDVLVLTKDGTAFEAAALADGFTLDGSDVHDRFHREDPGFMSLSRGTLNLIVTRSRMFFRRFLAASSVARRLNLLDKQDRIAVFQAVLYGNASGHREPHFDVLEAIAEIEDLFPEAP